MAYTFDSIFAVDPNNPSNVAKNASITIFDPADATKAPVAITDPTGSPLLNPITLDAAGMGPAFQHATLDRLGWTGGGFTGYFTSFEGIKAAAVAAQAAAETAGADAAAAASAGVAGVAADADAAAASAAASATAAANSAALVNAPADDAIAAAVNGTGTATRTALNATIATGTDAAVWQASGMGATFQKRGVIIEPGKTGEFDDEMVESLNIFFNHEDGGLYGTYTGYGRFGVGEADIRATIGLARSFDNGLTWEKQGQFFAGSGVDGTPDEGGCTGSTLFYNNRLWYHYYIGLTEPGYEAGTKRICLATTPSLINPVWTRRGAVISPSGVTTGPSAWRAGATWHPSRPVFAKGKWHIFFNASDVAAPADQRERIGYATADTLTGPWTVQDATSPLLSPTAGELIIGDPMVMKIPGGWRMGYFTAGGSGGFDWYTTTTDDEFPLGWTPHDPADLTRRVLAPTPGTYDSMYAHKGIDYLHGGRMLHPYTAVDADDNRVVALAIDPPIIPASLEDGVKVTGTTDTEKLASLLSALAGLGLAVSGVSEWVSDDFERPYSDLGLTTAPTGQVWREDAGSWYLDNGVARPNGFPAGGNAAATIEPGREWATFQATLVTMPAAGLGASLVFRYDSDLDYIYVEAKSTGAVEAVRVAGGNVVEIFGTSAAGAITAGQQLRVVQNPTTGAFTVYANNVSVITATSTFHLARTRVGIRSYNDYNVGWDDVKVIA